MMSGTDNGVISMTETVSFDLNKFKFLLNLFNLSCNLQSEDEVFFDDKSEVIKNLSGGFMADSWLNRKKRNDDGIIEIEKELASSSLKRATNFTDLEERYGKQQRYQQKAPSFYFSKTMLKMKRRREIGRRRGKDRACSLERRATGGIAPPIMFIGDRGYGYGIKRHLKYGGKWKQTIHSRYTSVFISNEYMSSQTCPYCFTKIEHPIRIVEVEGNRMARED
ncbi:unnamed protein product [Mucor hiemalis]